MLYSYQSNSNMPSKHTSILNLEDGEKKPCSNRSPRFKETFRFLCTLYSCGSRKHSISRPFKHPSSSFLSISLPYDIVHARAPYPSSIYRPPHPSFVLRHPVGVHISLKPPPSRWRPSVLPQTNARSSAFAATLSRRPLIAERLRKNGGRKEKKCISQWQMGLI